MCFGLSQHKRIYTELELLLTARRYKHLLAFTVYDKHIRNSNTTAKEKK